MTVEDKAFIFELFSKKKKKNVYQYKYYRQV